MVQFAKKNPNISISLQNKRFSSKYDIIHLKKKKFHPLIKKPLNRTNHKHSFPLLSFETPANPISLNHPILLTSHHLTEDTIEQGVRKRKEKRVN